MSLAQIGIHSVRNLTQIELLPSPQFNIFYGANGSGKTSILEAIYYLAFGRSFRTRHYLRVIQDQCSEFTVFGQIQRPEQSLMSVGLQRNRQGNLRLRLAQDTPKSLIEITRLLPLQLLNGDSRLLLTGGSKLRRQFIDWGVFHVEPHFFEQWQRAQRILKQRNADLRQKSTQSLIRSWDEGLSEVAHWLDLQRAHYVEKLQTVFLGIIQSFLPLNHPITVEYRRGWDVTRDLREVLSSHLGRDLELGYTYYGPHRADLCLRYQKLPIQDILSQGQQKLVVYALRLAQGLLLEQYTLQSCIYLLDDLPAELDLQARAHIMKQLESMRVQVFVTGIERSALHNLVETSHSKLFHVEQGGVWEE